MLERIWRVKDDGFLGEDIPSCEGRVPNAAYVLARDDDRYVKLYICAPRGKRVGQNKGTAGH